MEVKIKGRVAAKMKTDLQALGVKLDYERDDDSWSDVTIDLPEYTQAEVEQLRDAFKSSGLPGTKIVVADINKYLRAAKDGIETVTARSVRQAAWIMEQTIARLPHHLIFRADEFGADSYVGYYVNDVEYNPERTGYGRNERIPEHVAVELVYVDDDTVKKTELTLEISEVEGKTAAEMLRGEGYVLETPTLIERLRVETERCYEVRDRVGERYQAVGVGICDRDDMTESTSRSWRTKRLKLDAFGPTPAVIDVNRESDKAGDSRDRDTRANLYRWHPWNQRFFSPSEDDLARRLEADTNTDFRPEIQVPVHPLVTIFDLRRHLRMRAHVNNLQAYVYRPEVADGLIIPKRDRELINLLVDHSANTFQDIVTGKGQSMNVLACGAPGVGKTLTAEVFAEFKGRPLYTVQCSQLGIDPETIETNLGIILRRANRWNAVLLFDEADVYIARRGASLAHNAIVGVFLRMLEYASCILFMTTNRADDVDDAIASRCIVRLNYETPSVSSQRAIWRRLADLNNVQISDELIFDFANDNPQLTGRDVKNLLKLATFVVGRGGGGAGGEVTRRVLDFALEYKPTTATTSGDVRDDS